MILLSQYVVVVQTLHLIGPDYKVLIEREELVQFERWELGTCVTNHLKQKGVRRRRVVSIIPDTVKAVS